MTSEINKICDAADWFGDELNNVISGYLRERPRLHRKQWEFGQILRVLGRLGYLDNDSHGLGLGSGHELAIYALIPHVASFWATDLYSIDTSWEVARTKDPLDFIKSRAPFPVPFERLKAKAMDMREIEFPDNHFDFAYSSCAFEHIGHKNDFIRHLSEVHRVLKPGGHYVFTTEVAYHDQGIYAEGNYIFDFGFLKEIIDESPLSPTGPLDFNLFNVKMNAPIAQQIGRYLNPFSRALLDKIFLDRVHVQLSYGPIAFTSALIVLKKSSSKSHFSVVNKEGACALIDDLFGEFEGSIQSLPLELDPLEGMPNGRSRFLIGHEGFAMSSEAASPNIFETGYNWLSNRAADITVRLYGASEADAAEAIVNKHLCYEPWNNTYVTASPFVYADGVLTANIKIDTDRNSMYSIYGRGKVAKEFSKIDVKIS